MGTGTDAVANLLTDNYICKLIDCKASNYFKYLNEMKIKNLFIGLLASALAFAACEPEQTLDTSKLELSETTMSFDAETGSKTLTVTAGRIWMANIPETADWVSVTPATGPASADPQTVTVTVGPNDSYERTAEITFTIGLDSKKLTVTQTGNLTREYTNISAVRDQMPGTVDGTVTLGENVVVKGVVVSNKELDNFTSGKTCYVQDATGGLQIFFETNHDFAFGDKVELDLSGATLMNYAQSPEVSGLENAKATKIGTETVVAKQVSMADYLQNKFEGQYIEINEPVQISSSDLSKTWVVGGAHTNINAEDVNGNTFVIRSGKFASYGDQPVAQGSGKIKGIATVYNSTIQLVFAQESDFAGLTDARLEKEVVAGAAEGLVVAVSEKTYLIKTADGYSYVFIGEDNTHTVKVGDQVSVTGESSIHNSVPQLINPVATVKSSNNAVAHPEVETLNSAAIDAFDATAGLFDYVKVTGLYSPSGKYHNVIFDGASRKGSLVYPASSMIPAESSGKNIDITGYFVGISGSIYFNILVTDIKISDVQPEAPEGEACTMIDKVVDLVAGSYYMAGYLTENSDKVALSPYHYHVWTGTTAKSSNNSDCVTVSCSYIDNELAVKSGEAGTPKLMELVAVAGKANTYYVKVDDKYLTSTENGTNRRLELGTTQTEWVASDFTSGGVVLSALGVNVGTGKVTSKFIRSYRDATYETSLGYGLVFFKKN